DEVCRENPESRVTQEQGEAEGRKDLRQHRPAYHVTNEREVDGDPKQKQYERSNETKGTWTSAQPHNHQKRHVHTEHDEFNVREVDEIHHAPDQCQTRGEQRIDSPKQQAAYDHLQQQHRLLLPAFHGPFQLGAGCIVRPDQLILLALELDQVSGGKDVLAGRIELDAVVAHHQLLGLQVGLAQSVTDLFRVC